MNAFIVDAQLPPSLSRFLRDEFEVDAWHVQDLGLRDAADRAIGDAARARDAVVITKDEDYVAMAVASQIPGLILLTCGNVSNSRLRDLMRATFRRALETLDSGARLVEIEDESSLA